MGIFPTATIISYTHHHASRISLRVMECIIGGFTRKIAPFVATNHLCLKLLHSMLSISRISTSPKLDAQFEALDEASTIVSHSIKSIKDGSNSSFTGCLTAFVTSIIIARNISTRNKKKSTHFCVNVEDFRRANNRKSFPSSPSSNWSSGRRLPTTPKSSACGWRGRSEIEPMYSTPVKRLSRSKTRSGTWRRVDN